MDSLARFAHDENDRIAAAGLARHLHETCSIDSVRIRVNDDIYVNFAGNDYFGLSQHPDVLEAMRSAKTAGAGASRLITGTHKSCSKLEQALADYKGTAAALLYGSGYLANIGVITALANKEDMILADRLSHACMLDGAKLSGATLRRFKHNDTAHLEQMLTKYRNQYRHCIVLTETIFSMDGDCAPLNEILGLAERYDCFVVSDDAHGLAIVPPRPAAHHVQVGTLSKGLAGYGGYVCASKPVIELLIQSSRSFMFSTALPPGVVEAAHRAFSILQTETARCERPVMLAQKVAASLGLPDAQSAILPVVIGDADKAVDAALQLRAYGVWVHAIRPPTVPCGTSRLRISLSAAHTGEQVDQLIAALQEVL